MITKLQKWGNSQGVRIPKQFLTQAAFSENDEVEIIAENNQIIIRHLPGFINKYSIEELFVGYNGEYKPDEEKWGPSTGREEW